MKIVYKITLYRYANILCNDVALLAAKSNGGKAIDFKEIIAYFDAQKKKYPILNESYIIGHLRNSLKVMVKIGRTYENCLVLERVEDWACEDEKPLKQAENKPNKQDIFYHTLN